MSLHTRRMGTQPMNPTPPRGRKSKSTGQALVEFALVIPVMLLMLAIAIDFGRLFFSYIEITNAAREGAAVGAHQPSNLTQIQTTAAQETSTQSQGGEHAITVSTTCKDSAWDDAGQLQPGIRRSLRRRQHDHRQRG